MLPWSTRRGLVATLLGVSAALLMAGAGRPAAGSVQAPPPKSLIYAGWFGSTIPTPSFIAANIDFLGTRPFDGLVVYVRDPGLTLDVSRGVMNNTPISVAEIAAVLAPLDGADLGRLQDNLAYVVGVAPPDFFADWSVPIQNFANFAQALKDVGIKGIVLDNEQYFNHWTEYPGIVADPTIPLDQYQAQARLRGKEVMEAMVAVYPEIVMMSLHGPYVSEPDDPPFQFGFPIAVPRNLLMGPFFVGFFEGLGALSTKVDGGEFYGLRSEAEFAGNRAWRRTEFPSDPVDCLFLPDALRPDWPDTISIAFGVYDKTFGGVPMNSTILTPTLARAIQHSDRYTWFYTEGPTFLKPPSQGGASGEWVNAVRLAVGEGVSGGGGSSGGCGLLGIEWLPILLAFRGRRSRNRRGPS